MKVHWLSPAVLEGYPYPCGLKEVKQATADDLDTVTCHWCRRMLLELRLLH